MGRKCGASKRMQTLTSPVARVHRFTFIVYFTYHLANTYSCYNFIFSCGAERNAALDEVEKRGTFGGGGFKIGYDQSDLFYKTIS